MTNCASLTPSELELREACTLYGAVNAFVGGLHSDGIATFNVARLVEELIKAERVFQGLSLYKEKLLAIPEKAKKAKRALQSKLVSMAVMALTDTFTNVFTLGSFA